LKIVWKWKENVNQKLSEIMLKSENENKYKNKKTILSSSKVKEFACDFTYTNFE